MVLPAPPRDPGRRTNPTGLLAVLLVVAVVVGTWWLSGGDPGTSTATPSPSAGGAAQDPAASPRVRGDAAGAVSGEVDPATGLTWVGLDDLPPEASETVDLIRAGGPFPYGQDGARFENREQALPDRPSGYYAEYTVETPGSPDRGARRLVTGSEDELFWTADHYDSFERVIW